MHRFLFICVLIFMYVPSVAAETVPEPDYASLLRAIEGPYTILQTEGVGEKSGRIFFLLQQENLYRVVIAAYGDTGWQLEVESGLLSKRGDVAPELQLVALSDTDDIVYIPVFYLIYYDDITPRSEENTVSHVTYTFGKMSDATWQLVDFATEYHVGNSINYGGGAFLYPYEIRYGGIFAAGAVNEDRKVFGRLDRDLRFFSVEGIPLTPDDALRMVNTEN